MATFENPANGHREAVGGVSVLWAALFGLFYFLAKGVWTHAAIQLLLIVGSVLTLGGAAPVVMLLAWIGYALAAPTILENRYRGLGWREVGFEDPPRRAVPARPAVAAPTPRPTAPQQQPQPETRECPQCAETVKAAAKICRFCRADLEPVTHPPTFGGFSAGTPVTHRVMGQGVVTSLTPDGEAVVQFNDGNVRAVATDYLSVRGY